MNIIKFSPWENPPREKGLQVLKLKFRISFCALPAGLHMSGRRKVNGARVKNDQKKKKEENPFARTNPPSYTARPRATGESANEDKRQRKKIHKRIEQKGGKSKFKKNNGQVDRGAKLAVKTFETKVFVGGGGENQARK